MTDRPITMSADSVRAILDGRKTQTRRVIVPQPAPNSEIVGYGTHAVFSDGTKVKCPYGRGIHAKGDRLWVKEQYRLVNDIGYSEWDTFNYVEYRAEPSYVALSKPFGIKKELFRPGWKSSRFMRREYSRILLEITDVQPEKLQDISDEDIVREGVPNGSYAHGYRRGVYQELWDRLNAKRGYLWSSNPWVWAIEFKRVEEQR